MGGPGALVVVVIVVVDIVSEASAAGFRVRPGRGGLIPGSVGGPSGSTVTITGRSVGCESGSSSGGGGGGGTEAEDVGLMVVIVVVVINVVALAVVD